MLFLVNCSLSVVCCLLVDVCCYVVVGVCYSLSVDLLTCVGSCVLSVDVLFIAALLLRGVRRSLLAVCCVLVIVACCAVRCFV